MLFSNHTLRTSFFSNYTISYLLMKNIAVNNLKSWFLKEKRDLPWRNQPSPYAVWVSEVMLQQTQVAVVIPYFERWMIQFPTIEALAKAPLDEVIKLWEGLGYYSRARNLHAGAQFVVDQFNGELPSTENELAQIKGLGPYTIGAIRSFAFQQKAAAVDGNVVRVLSRYYHLEDDTAKPKTQTKIRQIAEDLLPDEEPWIVNEALIELGATVCSRKPNCQQCPLKSTCLAYQNGSETRLPFKSSKISYEKLQRNVIVLLCEDFCLIKRGKAGEIMSDLHEFFYFESSLNIAEVLQKEGIKEIDILGSLPQVEHSFTRFRVILQPSVVKVKQRHAIKDHHWVPISALTSLAFSSGHKRILQLFLADSF